MGGVKTALKNIKLINLNITPMQKRLSKTDAKMIKIVHQTYPYIRYKELAERLMKKVWPTRDITVHQVKHSILYRKCG